MPDIFVGEKRKEKDKRIKEPSVKVEKKKVEASLESLEGHTHNPLSAYCYYPEKINFETRDSKEKVILFLRKHPITNIKWLIASILLIMGPFFLGIFPILNFMPPNFQFIAVLGWYLVATGYVLENFLSWFFNVYIVTDERIIDVDFDNLIYKEVSDANIDKIQDVTYKMGGVARTFFNYGDVSVQTASEVPNFDFLAVPSPDKVVRILQELRIEEEQEKLEGRLR